ncbi:hypothetical protein P029_05610 [Anaplasma phagocytophilum str. Norway variant2]|uniref:Uncharacterized protein n=1 Tax=Anaplasma phagocytophilum str. Norway variant2 TaxID=1392507 RepID=A0A161HXT1_ANAPH|nr:hypothetical protein P029_05610 [Anaplasma phagocytophilum str. Norway variant2]
MLIDGAVQYRSAKGNYFLDKVKSGVLLDRYLDWFLSSKYGVDGYINYRNSITQCSCLGLMLVYLTGKL